MRVDPCWRTSSFSGEANCVEVAFEAAVRDSKNPGAGHLTVDRDSYRALVAFACRGRTVT